MAIKVDMEHVFDQIYWDFIEYMLHHLGSPLEWVLECICNSRFGILINGRRTIWIEASCGLCQGCPLSSYLFIMCSELLSNMLNRNKSRGLGIGVHICSGGNLICHLLYADDTLLFAKATCVAASEMNLIMKHYGFV